MSHHPRFTDLDMQLALKAALNDGCLDPARQEAVRQQSLDLLAGTPAGLSCLLQQRGPDGFAAGDLRRCLARARAAAEGPLGHALFVRLLKAGPPLPPDVLTAVLETPPSLPPARTLLLTPAQERAWKTLGEVADLYFSGTLRAQAVQPRTALLVAGPSGSGKSHLVQAFARARGFGFLRLCFGDWQPQGSKKVLDTVEEIRLFLQDHERALIQIDELDKIRGGAERSDWGSCILNDLFGLLDRTLFDTRSSARSREEGRRRLRESTLLVGSGTWHDLWPVADGARPAIGFGPRGPGCAMPDQIRAARCIPPELLNRFCPELILLPPMQRADFAAVVAAEGLEVLAGEADVAIDLEEAVQSGLGMRWLEALVLKIHLALRSRSAAARDAAAPAAHPGC